MAKRCPGSGEETLYAFSPLDPYAPCSYCRLPVRLNRDGTLRAHKGLPMRPDGSCPYRCPLSCDFDCYFPRKEA